MKATITSNTPLVKKPITGVIRKAEYAISINPNISNIV
jgi:hypothetical protein